MNKPKRRAIILFAKDPVCGRVKTRLASLLDEETTLKLYLHFLTAGLSLLESVQGADRFIAVAPPLTSEYFQSNPRLAAFAIFTQEGDDLGQRMRQAFAQCFEDGYERVVIVGADSPSLPVEYVQRALDSDQALTLGPAVDGGYYLIGMGPQRVEIFENVHWGTGSVLSDTGANARREGVEVELLPVWYDVDRPEDLRFLKTHMELSRDSKESAQTLLKFLETLEL
ncbi:MAG: hypothetical protein COV66_04780 [Nitrospinae bacterium CG11_big_fil_rev_8_21_14_0_20_45_15]|nr:MAG: hypothetical protein COV66_04780 [Nitrospinae bacterium CG11_big_fil_rev_8_21_14_0_20_45_15]